MTQRTCPYCMSDTGIRKIMYGMPMEEPDPDIYIVAGCIFPPEMPPLGCVHCGWRGSRDEVRKATRARRFIWTDSDGLIINLPNPGNESNKNLD